jgi:N-acyl-D-amino-acid deacylase
VRRASTPTSALRDGLIVAIGDLSGRHPAAQVLDARGCIVAPGFIDAHTHDDQALLRQPDMAFKVSQGVTTVVTGNCGISIAPLPAGVPLPMPLSLMGSSGHGPFPAFTRLPGCLARRAAGRQRGRAGGPHRLRVGCMARRGPAPTDAEIADAMRRSCRAALQAGAIGLSTGTAYPPAMAATTEEIIAVGQPLGAHGGLYVTHMRNESDAVVPARWTRPSASGANWACRWWCRTTRCRTGRTSAARPRRWT